VSAGTCNFGFPNLTKAAPDLLAACELFIEWCKTPDKMVTPEVIDAIHGAVEKAKRGHFQRHGPKVSDKTLLVAKLVGGLPQPFRAEDVVRVADLTKVEAANWLARARGYGWVSRDSSRGRFVRMPGFGVI
jgi:hypothetical protein